MSARLAVCHGLYSRILQAGTHMTKEAHILQADLMAEKSRREEAEAYLSLYKLGSWGLGFTTAACATLAIVSMLRCRN